MRPGLGLRMRSVGQNHAHGLFASSGTRNRNSLQKTELLGGQGGRVSGPDATWGGRLQPARQSSPSGRIAVQLEAWEELGVSSLCYQPRPPWWDTARGSSPGRDPAGVEGLVLLGPRGLGTYGSDHLSNSGNFAFCESDGALISGSIIYDFYVVLVDGLLS